MIKISLIAAVDEKNGIGKNNQLLCHLPADLQYFKKITMGKPILMGRKTFLSIGRPLPGRINIVLSSHYSFDGVITVDSWENALAAIQDHEELMVIGGGTLFTQAMSFASKIYLTIIHHQFNADTFFPALDPQQWHCQNSVFREKDEKNKYDITFKVYERMY